MAIRVLSFAPYATVPGCPAFQRNRSGFGQAVWDITRWTAALGPEVHLFTYQLTGPLEREGVKFAGHRLRDAIRRFEVSSVPPAAATLWRCGAGPVRTIRLARYFGTRGLMDHLVRRLEPDIVHVHGLTVGTLPMLESALGSGRRVLVTLHGLNFDHPALTGFERRFEVETVRRINAEGIPIAVVSSGTRARMVRFFDLPRPERVLAIPHGIDPSFWDWPVSKSRLRDKHGVPRGAKVVLNVGSLTRLKNQEALIGAVARLPESLRGGVVCLLAGKGPERGRLQDLAASSGVARQVFLVGYKEGRELAELYKLADLTAIVSKSEGFGRPFLESMATGTPVLAFDDLDAVTDVYERRCLHLVHGRDPASLSRGIAEALGRSWDSATIRNWARRFSWETEAGRYCAVYRELTETP